MEQKPAMPQESASIFEEIEMQLDTFLSERKRNIQKELESKIELEKKEAEERISKLEQEMSEERDSLNSYRSTLAEYENNKKQIKEKIKEHLAKAMEYQPQIESLTVRTFDELKKVMELNQQLEEINAAAMSRLDSIKQKMQEKYGITPPDATPVESEEVQFNLNGELEKLKRIKELLGQNSFEISDNDDGKHDLNLVTPPTAEDETGEAVPEERTENADEESVRFEGEGVEAVIEMEQPHEGLEGAVEDTQVSEEEPEYRMEIEQPAEEMETTDEGAQPEMEASETGAEEREAMEEMEVAEEGSEEIEVLSNGLESFRKVREGEKNIRLTYFEGVDHKLMDGQELVDTITKTVSEANGLFDRLTGSNSPKEQFFSKQEILWHQETLREYIQEALQFCEKEKGAFPKFLEKVFNPKVLKDLQTRLSQENWSNSTNFSSFKEYAEELKADFLDKSTPRLKYLQFLTDELKKG